MRFWVTRNVYVTVWDNIKARLHCCSQFDLDVVLSKQSTNVQVLVDVFNYLWTALGNKNISHFLVFNLWSTKRSNSWTALKWSSKFNFRVIKTVSRTLAEKCSKIRFLMKNSLRALRTFRREIWFNFSNLNEKTRLVTIEKLDLDWKVRISNSISIWMFDFR